MRSRTRGGHGGGRGGGGHHGGAWKVAYADFTTAMMAFFMLMWILASSSPKQKQAIAQYFRNDGAFQDGGSLTPGDMEGGPSFLEMSPASTIMAETSALELVAQQLEAALEGGAGEDSGEGGSPGLKDQVKISVSDEGLIIEIADDPQDELFPVGKADMNAGFGEALDAVAAHLKTLPNPVRLEGYTDARQYPEGAAYTNWELSVDRANAARRRLETHGLARARFQSVVGYGDGRLAVPDAPLAPGNRRITITVLRQNPVPHEGGGVIESPVQGFRPLGEPYVPPQAPSPPPAQAPAENGHGQ